MQKFCYLISFLLINIVWLKKLNWNQQIWHFVQQEFHFVFAIYAWFFLSFTKYSNKSSYTCLPSVHFGEFYYKKNNKEKELIEGFSLNSFTWMKKWKLKIVYNATSKTVTSLWMQPIRIVKAVVFQILSSHLLYFFSKISFLFGWIKGCFAFFQILLSVQDKNKNLMPKNLCQSFFLIIFALTSWPDTKERFIFLWSCFFPSETHITQSNGWQLERWHLKLAFHSDL